MYMAVRTLINAEEVVYSTMEPQKTALFNLPGEMVTFDLSLEARVTLCQAKREDQTSHVRKKKRERERAET